MTNRSKIETFIGFAIKARAFVVGGNAIATVKKAYLLLLCASASDNTKKLAQKYCKKLHCDLLLTHKPLEDLCGKENCKIAVITDKNLANAVLMNKDENFSVYSGGNGL